MLDRGAPELGSGQYPDFFLVPASSGSDGTQNIGSGAPLMLDTILDSNKESLRKT